LSAVKYEESNKSLLRTLSINTKAKQIAAAHAIIFKKYGAEVEINGQNQYIEPKSLYCFGYESAFRKKMIWLVNHKNFDRFIIFSILVNSIILGMFDFGHRVQDVHCYDTSWNDNLETMGLALSIIFLIECMFKVIAMGLVMHKNSYLKDSWNWLDFFVVLVSISDFFPGSSYVFLKILRMGRILRPLRAANALKRIRILIQTLLKSISGMVNVMLFLSFILSLFCILFVL
jgi:hypothetical protein